MKNEFVDQLGRTILLKEVPKKIISLVPSQTELLFDLDLEEEVIGITKFCVRPKKWFKSKTRIGGTKSAKIDLIESLQPDLIIANKEENDKDQIEYLASKFPLWISDVKDLDSALEMILEIGNITNRKSEAQQLYENIQKSFEQLTSNIQASKKNNTVYFIWREPLMVAGGGTFINEMLELAGFNNVFSGSKRYPTLEAQELLKLKPDIIFLPSEPFPFKEKHIQEFLDLCPTASIKLVDGEIFSWYGSRLIKAAPYFQKLRTTLFSET